MMSARSEIAAVFELVGGQPRSGQMGGAGGGGGGGSGGVGGAAIALIEVRGDVDAALKRAGIRGVPVGVAALRDLAGIDHGVVARWTPGTCTIMPHAGPEVVRRLMEHLDSAGLGRATDDDVRAQWPEARSLIEARVLAALARTQSARGVEALLKQVGAWEQALRQDRERRSLAGEPSQGDEILIDEIAQSDAVRERSAVMNRLITPPTVVALGAPNIGKSSLVNALAGRSVSLTADHAGTTRDHVGVTLDLGGLAVRWLDLPGVTAAEWRKAGQGPCAFSEQGDAGASSESIHDQAIHVAVQLARAADVLVLCGDGDHPAIDANALSAAGGVSGSRVIPCVRVHLRADLPAKAGATAWASDVRVSLHHAGRHVAPGLEELVTLVREALVPDVVQRSEQAWRFW